MPDNIESLVSIVITTKNEEKHIENCLMSISKQSYPHIEIIVVDNYSTDRTKELSRKYTSLIFDKGPERSAQRNFGMIGIAKGKYVMFVDADMILSPKLIEKCVKELEEKNCLALHISEIVLGTSYWCKVRRFERSFYDGTVIDGARFFLRNVFVDVGGFDETMSGPEDWDLDKKIKLYGRKKGKKNCIILLKDREKRKIPYEPEQFNLLSKKVSASTLVIYHNESEFYLTKYTMKKKYYATSFSSYVRKWGKNDHEITKQLGIVYRFFVVFFENGKWKQSIRHPILLFSMYSLKIIVGFIYIGVRTQQRFC